MIRRRLRSSGVAFSSHGSGLPPLQRIRPIVPVEIVGAEVQAAIVYELFRLDFDKERTLTFERMRPCYLHCLKTLTNEHVRIAESYERIGGDSFAQTLAEEEKDIERIAAEERADNDNDEELQTTLIKTFGNSPAP